MVSRVETPKIVQPRNRAVYLWVLVPLLMLAGGLFGWQLVDEFRMEVDSERSDLQVKYDEQLDQIAKLTAERDALRNRVAALERSGQIDREATNQIRTELGENQAKQQAMEQELTLLRQIVSTGVKKEALYIQGFRLEKGPENDEYRFKFTVSQALKSSGPAQGWIYLQVEGESKGEQLMLDLADITLAKSEKLKMRFRHFQDVDGLVQLPGDFVPKSVVVEVKSSSKKLPSIKKRFDWLVAG